MAESEEELKSLLMKVKEESEKLGLKLNMQEIKIMASVPITLWQIDGETVNTVACIFTCYLGFFSQLNLEKWVTSLFSWKISILIIQCICYWVQACSAHHTTGQWIWETKGWGKEETLIGETADWEDGRLAPQNNHLIWSGCWVFYRSEIWQEVTNQSKKAINLAKIS